MAEVLVKKKGVRIRRLKRKLQNCMQRGLSLESYYTKMNTLWQQLEALYQHQTEEEEKVHQLLMGLKFPQGIMDEILMRLPPKPLFKFKSVSIRCKSLVMDPEFARKYTKQGKLRGGMLYPLIENSLAAVKRSREIFPSPHVDHIHHHLLFFYTTNVPPSTKILASSNGLILSWLDPLGAGSIGSDILYGRIRLWLSNPLINKSFNLPHIYGPSEFISRSQWTCSFVTRETNRSSSPSPSYKIEYKVVFILRPERVGARTDSATIKIFSSDTGSWVDVVSNMSCPPVVFRNFFEGPDFCYKGILHWIDDSDSKTIVTYDPYDSPCRFGHIPFPNAKNNVVGGSRKILNLFHLDHEDVVKCCEIERSSSVNDDLNLNLLVWRIVDYGKGEWCLEQRCRISSLCGGGLLKGCRQVIAPDPWNPEGGFCYVFATDYRVTAVDLGSGKEEDVNIHRPFYNVIITQGFDRLPLVPFVYCPWSSPCPDQMPVLPRKMAMKTNLGFFGSKN